MKKDLKQLVEDILAIEFNLLYEQVNEINEPLYHITYSGRLDGISDKGLVSNSGRSIGGISYDKHAEKGIFLTTSDGISYWYSKSEDFANHNSDNPLEDGLVPIVLKIDPMGLVAELNDDELGSDDSRADAFIYQNTISPDYIDVWEGSSWLKIYDWNMIDFKAAFDIEELDGYDGEEEVYYIFKYTDENPLVP